MEIPKTGLLIGENFYIQEIYPKEFQFWKEMSILDLDDYTPMINSFGNVLFTLSDDEYSCDTFVLYYTGGEWLSSTKKLFINCVMKILIEFEKEEEKRKA